MIRKIGLLSILFASSALFQTGCQVQPENSYSQRMQSDQSYPEYSDGQYEVWVGPGWYYGVYFSREGLYRDWRRRHYGRHRSYRRYEGRRFFWGGGRRHGGGGRHHGGGGRHRGGGHRGRR